MPELPEVETLRRQLGGLAGVAWSRVVARPSSLFRTPAAEMASRLAGRALARAGRKGKVLLLAFDSGDVLLVHLGMSGQVLLAPPAAPGATHRHLEAELADGRRLVFRDPRRFGFLRLARGGVLDGLREVACVGADPLEAGLSWDRFAAGFHARAGAVKARLLDQALWAGIGNVYADEILHAARLKPARAAASLTPPELKGLFHAVRDVLAAAVEAGGTSFDEAYTDLFGRPGLFGGRLAVYGRAGEPCPRCHSPLVAATVAGRSSVYCPHCQK